MTALLWLSLVVLQSAAEAQPATAVIRGRVTDKDSEAPIARAVVRLASRDSPGQQVVTLTDNDGRYELGGLAAGTYSGFVAAGQHRATHLTGWLGDDRRGQMVLKAGEVRTEVNIALPRAMAMTVRVVDEWGEPLAGVWISLKSADSGATQPPSFRRWTDDRGRLRIYQFAPGRYFVCAQSGTPPSNAGAADAPLRERFLPTCYPSAASDAQAQPVRIDGSRPGRGRDSDAPGTDVSRVRNDPRCFRGAGAEPLRFLRDVRTERLFGGLLSRWARTGALRLRMSHRATTQSLRPPAVPRGPSSAGATRSRIPANRRRFVRRRGRCRCHGEDCRGGRTIRRRGDPQPRSSKGRGLRAVPLGAARRRSTARPGQQRHGACGRGPHVPVSNGCSASGRSMSRTFHEAGM